jgi:adenylate cyclase
MGGRAQPAGPQPALSRFESVAWATAVQAGGRVVKMIGDEVLFSAPSADAACRIAAEGCRSAEHDLVLWSARGAAGYGQVTPREGDYFGPLINLVARLIKLARPGTVVTTEGTAASLARDRWKIEELDPQVVRGLEAPVRIFDVSRRDAGRPGQKLG